MKIIPFNDQNDLKQKFLFEIDSEISASDPPKRIELATGASFEGIYESLAKSINDSNSSLKVLKQVYYSSVDELLSPPLVTKEKKIGVFAQTLKEQFLDPAKIPENMRILPGYIHANEQFSESSLEGNAIKNLESYGRPDWVFLGLGPNGHIAFNEPGSVIDNESYKLIRLYKNSSFRLGLGRGKFSEPRLAITLSLKEIRAAKKLFLVINSYYKKLKPARLLLDEKRITSLYPVTLLREHPGLKVFLQRL